MHMADYNSKAQMASNDELETSDVDESKAIQEKEIQQKMNALHNQIFDLSDSDIEEVQDVIDDSDSGDEYLPENIFIDTVNSSFTPQHESVVNEGAEIVESIEDNVPASHLQLTCETFAHEAALIDNREVALANDDTQATNYSSAHEAENQIETEFTFIKKENEPTGSAIKFYPDNATLPIPMCSKIEPEYFEEVMTAPAIDTAAPVIDTVPTASIAPEPYMDDIKYLLNVMHLYLPGHCVFVSITKNNLF